MTATRGSLGCSSDQSLQEQDGPAPAARPPAGPQEARHRRVANSSTASQASEPLTDLSVRTSAVAAPSA